jgi:hypothetical protein
MHWRRILRPVPQITIESFSSQKQEEEKEKVEKQEVEKQKQKQSFNRWIRRIDIAMAITTLVTITIRDSKRFEEGYRIIWYKTLGTSIFAFMLNEAILISKLTPTSSYYTKPNTWEREKAYYTSVSVHIFFLHILPVVITATGSYMSSLK